MDDDKTLTVPYIVYEGSQARHERTVKRLILVIILLAVMVFATNALWLYVWNQYDYVDEATQDIELDAGEGNANYIGRDLNGEINNGTDKSDDHETKKPD